MTQDKFNDVATPKVIGKETIKTALDVFLHNSGLEEYGITKYVSEDSKKFGLNCGDGRDAMAAVVTFGYAIGTTVKSDNNAKGDLLLVAEVDSVANSEFFSVSEKKKSNSKILKIFHGLRSR